MHAPIAELFLLIFAGAALLATVALYTRQPVLVAYIAIGIIAGPNGIGWVGDPAIVRDVSEIGIIFLLFLVGLDLQPSKLRNILGKTVGTALASSAAFFAIAYAIMWAFGFHGQDAWIAAIAAVFSSTIVGLKLLPTTVLHHRHIGEIVVGLLLIQDLLAIVALIVLGAGTSLPAMLASVTQIFVALPLIVAVAFLAVRYGMLPLMRRWDAFHEFIFLAAVGWCFAVAFACRRFGLSLEIGAFVAGVTLATSPIAMYIAESLRPLRDFFLVLFFFSVGAGIDPHVLREEVWPVVALASALIVAKPLVLHGLLRLRGEDAKVSLETGVRLGQMSEFSLLLVFLATSSQLMSASASHVVQGATVLTFVLSTYLVIFRYPSPIAVIERLRRD